jgi:hypothetical protein
MGVSVRAGASAEGNDDRFGDRVLEREDRRECDDEGGKTKEPAAIHSGLFSI